jgi:xylulokinase
MNLGLKSMRAVVFGDRGERLAIAYRAISTRIGEGAVEQDPDEWWAAGVDALNEVLADRRLARTVDAVTVTASAGCLVVLDAAGRSMGTAMMISDVRATEQADRIGRTPEFASLASSGRVTPDMMLPKILWLKERDPSRFAGAASFVTPNDFLLYRLTGQLVTDSYNATKYLFEPTSRTYPLALLRALGLDDARFPLVVEPGESAFPIHPTLLTQFGLRDDVKAVPATYDAICAVYGAGVWQVGDACDVSGTVTSLRAVTNIVLPAGSPLFSLPHLAPGTYLAGGSNNLGGGVIEWAKQLLYSGDSSPYSQMISDVEDAPPGASGITFLPYLLGERAPIWDTKARGVFFGLGRNHQRADLIRAIFEGVGYSVVDIADHLASVGVEIRRVSASGGLARFRSMNQIKADMLGVDVSTTREVETTALGAALLAAVSLGQHSSMKQAVAAAVTFGECFEPNLARHAMYRDFFGMYRALYRQLRDLYREREALIGRHSEVLRSTLTQTENL